MSNSTCSFVHTFHWINISLDLLGSISAIAINPRRISHLIPLIDVQGEGRKIKSFSEFKEKYATLLQIKSEKELYALYCYHYGKTLHKLIGETGLKGKQSY